MTELIRVACVTEWHKDKVQQKLVELGIKFKENYVRTSPDFDCWIITLDSNDFNLFRLSINLDDYFIETIKNNTYYVFYYTNYE